MIFIRRVFIIWMIFISGSMAADSTRNDVPAVFVENPPAIDGLVNEEIWLEAGKVDSLYQREPNFGQPNSEPTEFYFCYDKNNLYIGMKCYGDPGQITAKEMARDVSLGNDDRVQVILDTFMDRRNGYWFQIGPRGSIGDALISRNGAIFNKQWDGLWDGRAVLLEDRWEAEIVIPFKTMGFDPGSSTWGLTLIRHIKKKSESSYWPRANLDGYTFKVSDGGQLTGLDGITQGMGLDIVPYGLAGMDYKKDEDSDYPADVGLDVFYQITPGLKAALTVNTDFAQTEVDARQINLTRFALKFPEKRDFFLDGSNYFEFGPAESNTLIPFFSRRLGLDETGNPIPIITGAKITGKVGNWEIGGLDILDDRENGARNFGVVRVNRNFLGESSFGMIATDGNAQSSSDNMVVGADLRLATSKFGGNKNLALLAYGLISETDGIPGRGTAWGTELNLPNDRIKFRTGYQAIEDGFVAGVGFVPRTGIRNSYLSFAYGPRPERWGILQTTTGFSIDYITDMQNHLETRTIGVTPLALRFLSGDSVGVRTGFHYEYLDEDFNIQDDIVIPSAGYSFNRWGADFVSAQHRRFYSSLGFETGGFYDGDRTDYQIELGWKISVPVFVSGTFEHRIVELRSGDFTADVYRGNCNFLFTPRLTLNNYVQYDNLSQKMGWQSRMQWILKPGNDIILVWNSVALDPLERFDVLESSARIKINYTFRF